MDSVVASAAGACREIEFAIGRDLLVQRAFEK